MNQKLILRLGGAAVAAFVLAYAASPLLAARALVQAAKSGDEQATHEITPRRVCWL